MTVTRIIRKVPAVVLLTAGLVVAASADAERNVFADYPGGPLPENRLATLDITEVTWVEIGDVRIEGRDYDTIKWPAATQPIRWSVSFDAINPKMTLEEESLATVTLEGGRSYSLRVYRAGGSGTVFLWIEDCVTGEVTHGKKAPALQTMEEQLRRAAHSDREADYFASARRGDLVGVMQMLNLGLDVNCRDRLSRTALIYAVWFDQVDTIDFLIGEGADINAKLDPPWGSTPLIVAASNGFTRSVDRLLQHPDVDVNARGLEGQTALSWAARKKYTQIIEQLLEHGADVNAKDNEGHTALDWAKGKDVKNTLRAAGGKTGKQL
jgi:ankyrin repeat protein